MRGGGGKDIVVSLVVPVRDDEALVPLLLFRLDRILDRLDGSAEVIFVDDGSRDTTPIVLAARAADDPRCRFIGLARPFGHQTAVQAGLEAARGDAIVILDADPCDTPETVEALVSAWRRGAKFVRARRVHPDLEASGGVLRRFKGSGGGERGDLRVVDRAVLSAFRALPVLDRHLPEGLGDAIIEIPVETAVPGTGSLTVRKLIQRMAETYGSPGRPLYRALGIAAAVSVSSLVVGLTTVATAFGGWSPGPHLLDAMLALTGLYGFSMMGLGLAGLHAGRVASETRDRPAYVISRRVGFDRLAAIPLPGAIPWPKPRKRSAS